MSSEHSGGITCSKLTLAPCLTARSNARLRHGGSGDANCTVNNNAQVTKRWASRQKSAFRMFDEGEGAAAQRATTAQQENGGNFFKPFAVELPEKLDYRDPADWKRCIAL
ncbi:hypothetical protein MRX96_016770 [Rhipicephalus microplus]